MFFRNEHMALPDSLAKSSSLKVAIIAHAWIARYFACFLVCGNDYILGFSHLFYRFVVLRFQKICIPFRLQAHELDFDPLFLCTSLSFPLFQIIVQLGRFNMSFIWHFVF